MQDNLDNMETLMLSAALQQGLSSKTKITGLSDGASNCWSIAEYITKDCKKVIKILDWFHIGKKFKERGSKIPEELMEKYNGAKWKLWHGKPKDSIARLTEVKNGLTDNSAIEAIEELIAYVINNINNIINYQKRQHNKLPFTSQLAELAINSIINERQKNKKMQWSRAGAHNILQIRTSIFSNGLDSDWNTILGKMFKKAA
jgi:hypothetical protein